MRLSKKGHFLGFGLDKGMGFIHYADLNKPLDRYISLNKFCKVLVDEKSKLGLDYQDLKLYLEFICDITYSNTDGCGGFVINISKDGNLNMVPFENVDFLSQSLDIRIESPAIDNSPTNSPTMGM